MADSRGGDSSGRASVRGLTEMTKTLHFWIFAIALATLSGPALSQSADEPTRDLLASQIRDQGFTCDKPKGAQREVKESRPNETVWILTCEHDTYRMTVIPDMAAKVEKLEK